MSRQSRIFIGLKPSPTFGIPTAPEEEAASALTSTSATGAVDTVSAGTSVSASGVVGTSAEGSLTNDTSLSASGVVGTSAVDSVAVEGSILNNKRISAMHFQKPYQPISFGE